MDTLLILAHQDDEALSCGGLVQRRVQQRLEVGLITVFNRSYNWGEGNQHEGENAWDYGTSRDLLGIGTSYFCDMPEGNTSKHEELFVLRQLESALTKHQPREVIIHDDQDRNQDHGWLSRVSKIALRNWAHPYVGRVLMCQSPDGLPKITNHYEPLRAAQMNKKVEAVAAYKLEARDDPHPRSHNSLVAQAVVWGSMCGESYAEAYRIYYQKEA